MKTIFIVRKDDINTTVVGNNISVSFDEKTEMNLDLAAAKELFSDLKQLIETIEKGSTSASSPKEIYESYLKSKTPPTVVIPGSISI